MASSRGAASRKLASGSGRPRSRRGSRAPKARIGAAAAAKILANAPIAAAIVNKAFEFIYFNCPGGPFFGYDTGEILGKDIREFINAEDAATAREFFDRLIERPGEARAAAFRVNYKIGGARWVSAVGKNMLGADGVGGIVIYARDDSERVSREADLNRTNTLLHAISEMQSSFIRESDPEVMFHKALEELLVLTESEYGFIGEILHDETGTPYLKTYAIATISKDASVQEFIEKMAPMAREFRNMKTLFGAAITTGQLVIANNPAGDPRRGGLPPVHPRLDAFMGLPIYCGKSLVGLVGMANRPGGYGEALANWLAPMAKACGVLINGWRIDNKRIAAEGALRESEADLNEAQRIAKIGSWRWDLATSRVSRSEQQLRNFGFNENCGDLTSEAIVDRIHPDDRARARESFIKCIKSKRGSQWAQRVVWPSGEERIIQIIAEPIVNDRGEVAELRGTTIDVTDRERMHEKLLQTQKLESLGVMAGGIAHDFNNLLTAILGAAGLAKFDVGSDSGAHRLLETIEESAQRAADLCRQLLTYAGQPAIGAECFDLNGIIREGAPLMQVTIPKRASLALDLAEGLAPIKADRALVRQVIVNLVANAGEALAPEGGIVRITTGARSGAGAAGGRAYLLPEPAAEHYIYLSVEDNGCGMPPETRAKLFDPFFTTKFAGRGLGLAAVFGIVKSCNGALKVWSEPGRGSRFEVYFPAARAGDESNRAGGGESGAQAVLIVDDEDGVRNITYRMLLSLGYLPEACSGGEEALARLREPNKKYAAVLLDSIMPRLSGVDVLRELRTFDASTPVFIMSGYYESEAARQFVELAPSGFLQKPFRLDELRNELAGLGNRAKR